MLCFRYSQIFGVYSPFRYSRSLMTRINPENPDIHTHDEIILLITRVTLVTNIFIYDNFMLGLRRVMKQF